MTRPIRVGALSELAQLLRTVDESGDLSRQNSICSAGTNEFLTMHPLPGNTSLYLSEREAISWAVGRNSTGLWRKINEVAIIRNSPTVYDLQILPWRGEGFDYSSWIATGEYSLVRICLQEFLNMGLIRGLIPFSDAQACRKKFDEIVEREQIQAEKISAKLKVLAEQQYAHGRSNSPHLRCPMCKSHDEKPKRIFTTRDAALQIGIEHSHKEYLCPHDYGWHLTSADTPEGIARGQSQAARLAESTRVIKWLRTPEGLQEVDGEAFIPKHCLFPVTGGFAVKNLGQAFGPIWIDIRSIADSTASGLP